MCGIVGYVTIEETKGAHSRANFMQQALSVGTLRGNDSTGAYQVAQKWGKDEEPWAYWAKELTDGYSFANGKDCQGMLADTNNIKYFVGHHRAATRGSVNVDNAHPFIEGPITMVHNGTLRTLYGLPTKATDLPDTVEVDSHVLCHNLALHSPEEVFSKVDGAFTVVWHDARDDCLRIVRNSERPIHLMQLKDQNTVLFASEGEMLYWLASRLDLKQNGSIYYPKPGEMLTFKPGELKPTVTKLNLYKPSYSNYGSSYGKGWDDEHGWGQSRRSAASTPAEDNGVGSRLLSHTRSIMLGGRFRAIPDVHVASLKAIGLEPDMRIRFVPGLPTAHRWDRRTSGIKGGRLVTLFGALKDWGLPAVMLAVPEGLYNTSKGATWSARPLAVVMKDGEPVVIVTLVSSITTNYDSFCTPQVEEKPEQRELPALDAHTYLPGPRGILISYADWVRACSDGCYFCGCLLMEHEASNIVWQSTKYHLTGDCVPICPSCATD